MSDDEYVPVITDGSEDDEDDTPQLHTEIREGDGEEEEDESDDDSEEGEEGMTGDYDDGVAEGGEGGEEGEEEEEGGGGGGGAERRTVSIQDYLAWRLLGREPGRSREEPRKRFVPFEDSVPRALPRGALWQATALATAAAPPARRNAGAAFDSELDRAYDASLHSGRTAPYGKKMRQDVLSTAAHDSSVAAAVSHLGPHPPAAGTDAASASARDAAAAGPSTPTSAATASSARSCATAFTDASRGGGGGGRLPAAPTPSSTARSGVTTRRAAAAAAAAASPPAGAASGSAAAASPAASPAASGGGGGGLDAFLSGVPVVSSPRMLHRRETGEGVPGGAACVGWGRGQMRHMACHRALPRYPRAVVDAMDSRAYIGQFSDNGQFFVAAFQDRRVRLYDVERGWKLRKDITTRMCRWTITDTSVSPDQRFVIYSSIIPVVHLVEVGSSYDNVQSIANITQVHEPLNFDETTAGGDHRLGRSFGIWSVQWSGDGREILAGTNDQSVVVLDVETKRVVARAEGHEDDVNAVTYADSSPNVIVSGSDDSLVKVWDRRLMPGAGPDAAGAYRTRPKPVGVLVGHTEGITHLHSRGDGTHVLSNAKDQTAKLWDVRMMEAGGSLRDSAAAGRLPRSGVPQFNWDYRWQEYPASGRVVKHPHDASIQTYRGHTVQHTLIRAYFSPAHSTAQRFIYTGSVEGGVHVYDVLTGQEVEGSPFRLHRKLVRDVSWHPFEPVMATVSWDGTVARWGAVPPDTGANGPEVPGQDAYSDFY
ncbi:hypothetical protein HYH03_010440 [Edaphochlamys debaryana]|uniref:Uncharacterized protein n=1 Tax=Edaphochlamys debaryana TaxID=47281 RepID=A0A836BWQ7_9CHLO|nr:hypothetical protein HYH03_010440 [Edaphochlamys debaryana]|eukprot:KAG2491232.1 hypothetical protein HYH03_010440 [Edaphochlamys debaryana]